MGRVGDIAEFVCYYPGGLSGEVGEVIFEHGDRQQI